MAVIATAEVRVVADTSRFLSNLRRQLRGAFSQMGAQAADSFNRQFQRNLGNQVNQTMQRTAQQGGNTFTNSLRTTLRRGLRGLQIVTDLNLALVQGFRAAGELGGKALIAGFRTSGRAIAAGIRSEIVPAFQAMGRDISRDLLTPLQTAFAPAVQGVLALGRAIKQIPNISFGNVTVELERGVRFIQTDLSRAFGGIFDNLAVGARLAFSRISDIAPGFFQQAADRIGPIFSRLYDAISVNTLLFNGRLLQHWDDGVGGLADRTTRSLDSVRQRFRIALASLAVDVGLAFRGVGVGVGRAFSAIGNAASRSFGAISTQANRAAGAVTAAFSRVADPIAASIRRTAPRIRQAFTRAFAPAVASASRAFNAIPWARIGQGIGKLFGRGVSDGAEEETERRGRGIGARFGSALTKGLITGLRGLGAALSAISLRPLAGLAGILGEATSEMLSMAGQGLVVVAFIESLSGALFAIPAALNVVTAGVATLGVAFRGFGIALGGAFSDAAEFEKLLVDLAPAAQDVAREFQAITPALTGIRVDTQQALFSQLAGVITNVANNLLPALREGLIRAATAFGGVITGIGEFLSQAASADTVTATFEVLAGIFDALAVSTVPFLEAMRLLADTFLPRIAEGIGPIAQAGELFRAWTERIVESGEAMASFNLAMTVLSQLGGIAADLAGIFSAMFAAAQTAGVSALGTIAAALDSLRAAMESVAGQQALGSLFIALGAIVNALAPVFGVLLTQLGLLAPIFAQIAEAVGPALTTVIQGLGAALQALGPGVVAVFTGMAAAAAAIAPALEPLGAAIGAVFTAISPLLPVIGQLIAVVIEFGAQILGVVATAITPIVQVLATSLAPVLPLLANLFTQLVAAVGPLVEAIGGSLAGVLATLLPPVIQLAVTLADTLLPVFTQIVEAITPLIGIISAGLISVLAAVLPPITELVTSLASQLAPVITQLVTALAPLIAVLAEGLANALVTLLPPIIELASTLASALVPILSDVLVPLIQMLVPVITPLIDIFLQVATVVGALLVPVIAALLPIISALTPLFELVAVVLQPILALLEPLFQLFAAILEPITTLITLIASLLTPVIELLAEILGAVINVVVALLGEALEPITEAFTAFGGVLAEHVIPWIEASVAVMKLFWEKAIVPLIDWVKDLSDSVNERFGTVRDAVSTLWNLWQSRFDIMKEVLSTVVDAVKSAADTIGDWFGDLKDTVADIWSNITDSIQGAADRISGIVDNVMGWVSDAISAASSLGDIDLNPFANGGIVYGPTAALIGEAGKEVVIPLTRPQRAAELAQQSGLIDLLAAQGALGGAAATAVTSGPPVEMHVHSGVADAEQVARRAVRIIERRMGGRGLERVSP